MERLNRSPNWSSRFGAGVDRQSIGGSAHRPYALDRGSRKAAQARFLFEAAGEEDRERDGTQRRAAQSVTQFGLRGVRRALL